MAKEPEMVSRNRTLAEAGDPVAQFNLGNMYRLGYQVKADRDAAITWLGLAAAQGHAEAVKQLGQMGVMVPEKPEEDTPLPLEIIADPLYDSAPEATAQELAAAATSGDAEAQIALGNAYRDGSSGLAVDFHQALHWFRLAADSGSAAGECALAMMYDLGLGVGVDLALAKSWYHKAARQGFAVAQFNLGNMIRQGRGGTANPEVAAKWFKKAAEQGDASAMFALGALYETGSGVDADPVQAMQFYRDAAARGDAAAQFNLSNMLRDGRGGDKDPVEAAGLCRRAAEQGLAAAQFNYALMLASGQGIERNEAGAARWLERAARQGDARAQFELGRLLAVGASPEDRLEAFVWLSLAADHQDLAWSAEARRALEGLSALLDAAGKREAEQRLTLRRGQR